MKNLITIGLLLSLTITGFTQEYFEPVKIFDTIKFGGNKRCFLAGKDNRFSQSGHHHSDD